MQETWVQSMDREDPVEDGMATHSSILAWRMPPTEEPGSYSPWGCKESETAEATNTFTHMSEPERESPALMMILFWGQSRVKVKVTQSCPTLCNPAFHGLYSPWNSPGQNTGMGSLSLLQGIFPTQGFPGCRQIP